MLELRFYFALDFKFGNYKKMLEVILRKFTENFDGYTFYTTKGYWKGISETSYIIEIITDKLDKSKIKDIERYIKKVGNQKEVLITYKEVNIL